MGQRGREILVAREFFMCILTERTQFENPKGEVENIFKILVDFKDIG
jgi:hypothetical protein